MEYFNNSVGQNLQYPQMDLIFARFYNLKGAKMADEGDLQEALANFNKSIELNPNYAMAHVFYAHFLASQRRIEEVLSQAKVAVELDPMNPYLLGLSAVVLIFDAGESQTATGPG